MADVFHKATWEKVQAGDVVLLPWASLSEIVEAEVVEAKTEGSAFLGKPRVYVDFEAVGSHFHKWAFDPEAVIYIKSRL
jgi:hypothetical protein